MKLVEVVVTRGHPDVVDAHIAYHLNAGVDFVIATDPGTGAENTEILESYVREGCLRRIPAEGGTHEAERRTRMARLAASEDAADWIINSDADEFWWPRGESLKDVLAPIPPRYTVVQGLRRSFSAGAAAAGHFSERMTARRSLQNGAHSVTSVLRPVHRADPNIVVQADGTLTLGRNVPLRAWYPIEVLHFPAAASEDEPGSLVVDTRLRDALRVLREAAGGSETPVFALPSHGVSHLSFQTPDVVDDAAYAVECAAVGEVDLPRLEQYVTELEERVRWLEQRLWPRVLRAASRLVGRGGR